MPLRGLKYLVLSQNQPLRVTVVPKRRQFVFRRSGNGPGPGQIHGKSHLVLYLLSADARIVPCQVHLPTFIVEAHDGQFVKSLGDGTMSSFPSARQALSAAQAIQKTLAQQTDEPRLSLRIGLHTGDVVQSDDDFFGSVVNLAARITGAAEPGTILVSDVTRAMVGASPDFTFAALAPVHLKGFDGSYKTHVLDWRA